MKSRLLITLLCLLIIETIDAQSKTQLHLDFSYTNPFEKENNFERIGSIIGAKAGLTFGLEKGSFVGFDVSTSLFIPKGGGDISKPEVAPKGTFKFSSGRKLWTEISVGGLYNPSAIGFEVDMSYLLEGIGNEKNLWSYYVNGVSQTFENSATEPKPNAPISWIATTGIKYIKPITNDLAMIIKPGIGLRGESGNNTKVVGNASVVFAWKWFNVVGAYTNKVPIKGFPTYFVFSAGFDAAKLIYNIRSKSKSRTTSPNKSGALEEVVVSFNQGPRYHDNILKY